MTKKILVIEDDPKMLRIIKDRLEANNYQIITAVDGEAGLNKARSEKPDLILLDILLPKLNGFTICRLLKFDETLMSIPIIMLTAKTSENDLEIGKKVGADAYLVKPFDPAILLLIIEQFIAKSVTAPFRPPIPF